MEEAFYVLGIKILRDKPNNILGLSQKPYINKILKKFQMLSCSPSPAPIVKREKFNENQCPQNDIERQQMENIP
jgi:hypothetical protein